MRRKNPCLETALRELREAGISDVQQSFGGKHVQLRWQTNGHGLRIYNMPATPSDWRSVRNTRAGVRRMLREDGLLVEPERANPTPLPVPKLDRFTVLEQRVAALEEQVRRKS